MPTKPPKLLLRILTFLTPPLSKLDLILQHKTLTTTTSHSHNTLINSHLYFLEHAFFYIIYLLCGFDGMMWIRTAFFFFIY